jgi:hypothetical protein
MRNGEPNVGYHQRERASLDDVYSLHERRELRRYGH